MKQNLLTLPAFFLCAIGGISAAENLTVSPLSGADITVALNEAKAGVAEVGDITLNLAENGSYTMSGSLEIPAGLVLNGNGATIEAPIETPFILMSGTPSVEVVNDYYRVGAVKVEGVSVSGLKNSIFYDNNVKYCVVDLSIDNSVFSLSTVQVENEALVSFKGGGAKDFTMTNSTVYGTGDGAKFFIRYNNSARLDRFGFDKGSDFHVMTYHNNTFYKVIKSDGQWANYSALSGQNYVKFDVQKNIWFDSSKDVIRRMAGGRFGGSAPVEMSYNTYFSDGASTGDSESQYDKSGNILVTDPGFKDVATGDFTIGAGTQQAKYQTGASKWLVEYDPAVAVAVDITLSPEAGTDLATALAEAKTAFDKVGNITINLAKDGAYTMSGSLEIPAGLVLNGNGATIEAPIETPFILMSGTPSVEVVNDYYRVGAVKVEGVSVSGLKNSIFYDNNVKYCVVDLSIDNSVFSLSTVQVENEALVSFKGGGAKDFTMTNSTVYGTGDGAKFFIRYNNSARLDRFGFDKGSDFHVMTYHNNTFYKVIKSDGQWANYSALSGQNYVKFDVQKNIWFDSSKDVIRRMAGGRFGGSAPVEMSYNTYFSDGASTGDSESQYDKSGNILVTDPGFKDVATGDFTIGAGTQQAKYQTGASKWLVEFVAEDVTEAKAALLAEIKSATELLGDDDSEAGLTLKAAIEAAQGVYDTAEFNQIINSATETLKAAKEAYALGVAKAALLAEINAAKELVGSDDSDGAKDLKNAIETAQAVYDTAVSAEDVYNALELLKQAEEAYKKSGIDGIGMDENGGSVEYYDLRGVRVDNPSNGVYIRCQGSDVTKVYVK